MMRCQWFIKGYVRGENSEGSGGEGRVRKGKKPNNHKSSPTHSLIPQQTLDDQIVPKMLSSLMVKDLNGATWLGV